MKAFAGLPVNLASRLLKTLSCISLLAFVFVSVTAAQDSEAAPRLKKISFSKDMTAMLMAWEWPRESEGKYNLLYSTVGASGVSAKVWKESGPSSERSPLIELIFDGTKHTAKIGSQTYNLRRGVRVLPESADPYALLLLSQKFNKGSNLLPRAVYDRAIGRIKKAGKKIVLAEQKKLELKVDKLQTNMSVGSVWDFVNALVNCSGSSATCSETEGLSITNTVTVTCVCGKAVCTSQPVQHEVTYYVFDTATNELKLETEITTGTVCVCSCVEPPKIERTPR